MRLMDDKRGLWLLKRVLNLVITVFVVLLLIVLIVSLWGLFTEDSELKKMEKQLDNIISNSRHVWENGNEVELKIFKPDNTEWYLLSSNKKNYPGECNDEKDCLLCICEKYHCKSSKSACKNVENFLLRVSKTGTLIMGNKIFSLAISRGVEKVLINDKRIADKEKLRVLDEGQFDKILESEVNFEGEREKLIDVIKYSLDPFYEPYGTFGSYAETNFDRLDGLNGLDALSLRSDRNYLHALEDMGFDLKDMQKINDNIASFDKSEEFNVLVREFNKICDDYMILIPQGVIYQGKLRVGPPGSNTPWKPFSITEGEIPRWKEFTKETSYDGTLEKEVRFKIKFRVNPECIKE
jgi:hypothetical protein